MTGTTFIAFSSGTNDLILGLAAAALVVFALFVSMVVPRKRPDFPGRSMGVFMGVAVLLVAGMLVAVEALGESHHFNTSEEASPGTAETTPADTTPPSTGSTETATTGETATGKTETGGAGASGDATAGKAVFSSAGCAGCHTLKEAGASGAVGPNLDDVLKGKSADFIKQSIVDPNAEIAQGFQPGVMPQDYGSQLADKDLADLVAFLATSTGG